MGTLKAIVGSDVAYRLGWALLHTVWGGAVVALLWAAATALLRRRSANTRYLVGCIAMGMMAVFPAAAFLRVPGRAKPLAAGLYGLPGDTAGPLGREELEGEPAARPPVASPPGAAGVPWPTAASRALEPATPWIALAWVAGVLVLSLRHLGGWVGAQRLVRRATHAAEASLVEALARLTRAMRITRPVRLLESAWVKVPTMVGWLRPAVLLPLGLATGLPADYVEALLAHELAHIRRHDYLVNLLQSVVETLLFYHPAVWLVSRRIRLERENCCDDLVVACGGEPAAYAEALARVAERALAGRPCLVAALAAADEPSELRRRVLRLIGRGADPRACSGWAWTLGLALILGILAGSYLSCRAPEPRGHGPEALRDGNAAVPAAGDRVPAGWDVRQMAQEALEEDWKQADGHILVWMIREDDRPLYVESAVLSVSVKRNRQTVWMLAHLFRHPKALRHADWTLNQVEDAPQAGTSGELSAPPSSRAVEAFLKATWFSLEPEAGWRVLDAGVCQENWRRCTGGDPPAALLEQASRWRRATPPVAATLAPFQEGGKWGFKDAAGNVVVEPKYDDVKGFSCGLAPVNVGAKFRPPYPPEETGKWGYVDARGVVVVPLTLDFAQEFSEGLALVGDAAGWRYIDTEGRTAITLGAGESSAGDFREGLAPLHVKRSLQGKDWLTRFIDKAGKTAFAVDGYAEEFHEGMAVVVVGSDPKDNRASRAGYVDRSGKVVISPRFFEASDFSEGLAAVRTTKTTPWYYLGDTWGYIDKSGKLVIEARFNEAHPFRRGIARVHVGGKLEQQEFHSPPVWEGGEWQLIDRAGKVLKRSKEWLEYDAAPPGGQPREAKGIPEPILQLWDGGNVFIQPKRTLILALWADGKVVSRVDEKGKCKLHFASPVDVRETKLMVGRIDPKRVSGIMSAISRAGFFETDEHSGFVRPDGPNVWLFARNATGTNEVQHEAVDDAETHAAMTTPEAKQFAKMWDAVMDTLRAIQPRDWRPVRPEDKVVTEIPWKRSENK